MSESTARRLVLDANLLVLLVVGLKSKELIASHKRTSIFMPDDYDLLQARLSQYDQIVVTPNVLTECSNMVRQVGDPLSTELTDLLGRLVGTLIEVHCPSIQCVEASEFARLGLTDAGLLETLQEDLPLLTTDAGLYAAALTRGVEAVNFNHLRMGSLLS